MTTQLARFFSHSHTPSDCANFAIFDSAFLSALQDHNLHFANCDYKELVEFMKHEKIQVDCILTDPPYNISRNHQLGFSNMGRAGMDYGKWDYGFNQSEWIKQCVPLLKEGGSIIIFNDWKNLTYIVEALESSGCVIKDLLRWEKSNPMPRNVNARYVVDFECAIKAVFKSGVVPGGKKRLHPTQKQLSVIEEILRIHTNENDLVFDPFSGSATTALACINNTRKFIGSEIDKKYFDIACVRLCDKIQLA